MVEIETVDNAEVSAFSNGKDDGWKNLMGEDLVMKVIRSERPKNNKDPAPVQPKDLVMVDFTARIAEDRSCTDGRVIQEAKDWFIVVADGDVLPALDLAIKFMESGSTAYVWSHSKYAFSNGTRIFGNRQELPFQSNVLFELSVSGIFADTSRLNPYVTLQKALNRKRIANDIYQNEWCPPAKTDKDPSCDAAMARAIRLYKKAAQEMDTLLGGTYFKQVEEDHPQRHEATQILLDSLNNIVAVYLRQKQFHEAKLSAVEVLKQDPKNIKALLRAAKASLFDPASTMEEVQAALRAADNEITYKYPQEEKELQKIKAQYKRKQEDYKKKTKEMFSNKLNEKAPADIERSGKPKSSKGSSVDEKVSKPDALGTENTEGKLVEETHESKSSTAFTRVIQVLLLLSLFFLYRFLSEGSPVEKSSTEESIGESNLPSPDLEL